MNAVDTNILVYAHREESAWHEAAFRSVAQLAESRAPWAIPAPCLHEFLAIVTHPRIYQPATPLERAVDQLDAWRESPSLVIIAESEGYWERLRELLLSSRVTGAKVYDARVAALCLHYRVAELWSADRDFTWFPELRVRNPLLDPPA
ncbi:MAG: type II toxin-antitoxin system VapC family toxin [Gemmatimonadota bacterium]